MPLYVNQPPTDERRLIDAVAVGSVPMEDQKHKIALFLGTNQGRIAIKWVLRNRSNGIDVTRFTTVIILDTDGSLMAEAQMLGIIFIRLRTSARNVEEMKRNPKKYREILNVFHRLPMLIDCDNGGGARAVRALVSYMFVRDGIRRLLSGIVEDKLNFRKGIFADPPGFEIVLFVGGCGSSWGCLFPLLHDLHATFIGLGNPSTSYNLVVASPSIYAGAEDWNDKMKGFLANMAELVLMARGIEYPLPYEGRISLPQIMNIFVIDKGNENGVFTTPNEALDYISFIADLLLPCFSTEEAIRFRELVLNLYSDFIELTSGNNPPIFCEIGRRVIGVNKEAEIDTMNRREAKDVIDNHILGRSDDEVPALGISMTEIEKELKLTNELRKGIGGDLKPRAVLDPSFVTLIISQISAMENNISDVIDSIDARVKALKTEISSRVSKYVLESNSHLRARLREILKFRDDLDPSNDASAFRVQLQRSAGRSESTEVAASRLQASMESFRNRVRGFWNRFKIFLGFRRSADQALNVLLRDYDNYARILLLDEIKGSLNSLINNLHEDVSDIISEAESVIGMLEGVRKELSDSYERMNRRQFGHSEYRLLTPDKGERIFKRNAGNGSVSGPIAEELLRKSGSRWNIKLSDKIATDLYGIVKSKGIFEEAIEELSFFNLLNDYCDANNLSASSVLKTAFKNVPPLDVDKTSRVINDRMIREYLIVVLPDIGDQSKEMEANIRKLGVSNIILSPNVSMMTVITMGGKFSMMDLSYVKRFVHETDPSEFDLNGNFREYFSQSSRIKEANFPWLGVRLKDDSNEALKDPLKLIVIAYLFHAIRLTGKGWFFQSLKSGQQPLGENLGEVIAKMKSSTHLREEILKRIMEKENKILSSNQSTDALNRALDLFTRRWRKNEEDERLRDRLELASNEIPDGPVIAGEVLKEMFDTATATKAAVIA